MQLQDLKPSISSLDRQSALNTILEMRRRRAIPKVVKQQKVVSASGDVVIKQSKKKEAALKVKKEVLKDPEKIKQLLLALGEKL